MSSSSGLDQINSFLEAGDYYSAHQKALTLSTRLLSVPRRNKALSNNQAWDDKSQQAEDVLWSTARVLLERNQRGSATELGIKLVKDVWQQRGKECGQQERAKIIQLIALMGPSGSWRKQFTEAVFNWSAKTGSGPAGDVEIHQYLGETLFKEQSYHLASLHLLVCPTQDAATTLADVMFQWSKLDPEGASAVGRYAARGMLSYLESTAILAARTFLSRFLHLTLQAHPHLLVVRFQFPPPGSPLAQQASSGALETRDELVVTKLASLNLLQLALKTCQTGSGQPLPSTPATTGSSSSTPGGGQGQGQGRKAWLDLIKRYEREITWLRSPELKESTAELGTIYFGIKPPRAGNPFADMLSGMFGGGGGPAAGATAGAQARQALGSR